LHIWIRVSPIKTKILESFRISFLYLFRLQSTKGTRV
jgi:hypothetical protein